MSAGVIPMSGILTGCDPELFLLDTLTGKHVSAHTFLPGTKAEPYKVPGGAIQVDGMAAEFNTDPASTFEEFTDNITKVLGELKKHLPKHIKLDAQPAVIFDQDIWEATPPEAKELGCTPDFNAWTGDVNPPPAPSKAFKRLRTASGHLHIGWTSDAAASDMEHINNCRDLVKQLDWFLGAWSLKVDPDSRRRVLYGKAGACRYKPYGVEYRVLSNFWISKPSMRLETWNRLHSAIHNMRSKFMPEYARPSHSIDLQNLISASERNLSFESRYAFPILSYKGG